MADRIKLRRDTGANWASINPILQDGELGIEKDTVPKRIKIGDGTTAWNSLPYVTPQEMLAAFGRVGALAVGAGATRYRFPWAVTVLGVTAAVGTAPTGAALVLDVNKNGTTMFTTQGNRPSIAAGANSTASEAVPDVVAVAAGDYLTVDVDQIGSTVTGSDLTVFIRYRKAG